MELVKSSFDFPAESTSWDAARYWVGMSARFKRADLACQVMAGFVLRELHQANAVKAGNPNQKQLPNDSGIETKRQSWPQIVKAELGVSDDTAGNWMKMADGVKAKWKKLSVRDRLSALMSVAPSDWTEADAKLITEAVHKATDGRTQLEFMWELGVAKKPPGNKNPTPRKPGIDLGEDDEEDELLKSFRGDMRLFTHKDDTTIQQCPTTVLLKHQEEVTAYAARIAETLARRKKLGGK